MFCSTERAYIVLRVPTNERKTSLGAGLGLLPPFTRKERKRRPMQGAELCSGWVQGLPNARKEEEAQI